MVLGLVRGQRADHHREPGDRRDLAEPGGEPPDAGGRHENAGGAPEAGEHQEPERAAPARKQVVGERQDDDRDVDPAPGAAQVVRDDPALDLEVDDEHDPRPDADDDRHDAAVG
jgi:hypothetical protein